MPCIPIPGGIACTRERRRTCSVAGCGNAATLLCDFPLVGPKAGRTCDRALCRAHAEHAGPNTDYCPAHATARKETDHGAR